MSFQDLVSASQVHFPALRIAYKDQVAWMRQLGRLFPSFAHNASTIGQTIYYPSVKFTKAHPVSCSVILLHELVHFYDQQRVSWLGFMVSYLFPRILVPICLAMCLISWRAGLVLLLLCLFGLPAVFRAYWEKRAYFSSLYVIWRLGKGLHSNPHLETHQQQFTKHFHGLGYGLLGFFHDNHQMDRIAENIKAGKRPFTDPIFDLLDELIDKV